jgi:hypothetical protein
MISLAIPSAAKKIVSEKATLTSDHDGHTLGASQPPQSVKRKDLKLVPNFYLQHVRKGATLCGRRLI